MKVTKVYIKSATVRRINKALEACDFSDRVDTVNESVTKSLGTSEEHLISNTDEGNFFLKHIDNKIKIGKILKAITTLTDVHIETVTTYWKSLYNVNTGDVVVYDNVSEAYNISECGGSCMAHKDDDYFEIYQDIGSKVVLILDEDGDLGARALIHDLCNFEASMRVKVIDRVFFSKEIYKITLDKWAVENGYKTMGTFVGRTLLSSPISYNYEAVPYADNLSSAVEMNGVYRLATSSMNEQLSHYDTLNETNGGSSDRRLSNNVGEDDVYCEDIEDYQHIDDSYYNNTHDCYYSCMDDLVYVEGSGYHHYDDEDIACDVIAEQYDFIDNMKQTYSGEWTADDSYVHIDVGTHEGYYAHYEDTYTLYDGNVAHESDCVYYSEDSDEYFLEEDLGVKYFEHEDGSYYSYEEEEENEDEEV